MEVIFLRNDKRLLLLITGVFFVIQTAIIVLLALKGRTDFSWSVIVTTSSWLAYTFLEIKFHIKMSTYVHVVMVLTIFFDAFFGYCLHMYENSFVFDKLLHIFGTYSFSLFVYILLAQMQDTKLRQPVKFILVLALGMSLGVFYEISEFIGDIVSHPTPPNQPSLLDTDIDLIGDTIGALLAATHASLKKSFV